MMDEEDGGTRIAVWTALGVVGLLLLALIGGLAMRSLGDKPAAASTAAPAPMVAEVETLLEGPLEGDLLGALYFASGQAGLPDDAAAVLATVKSALDAAPTAKLVLSGFHDATGDAAVNAELAKNRAKAVRAALQAAGVDASRIALRKPESTTGGAVAGDDREARRVEVRLLP